MAEQSSKQERLDQEIRDGKIRNAWIDEAGRTWVKNDRNEWHQRGA